MYKITEKEKWMKYYQATGQTIQEAFDFYHEQNPEVYGAFKRFTGQAMRKGFKKYSAKQILGRVRWHFNFEVKGDHDYKINDAFTSRYARLFADEFPKYADFFNYRELRS